MDRRLFPARAVLPYPNIRDYGLATEPPSISLPGSPAGGAILAQKAQRAQHAVERRKHGAAGASSRHPRRQEVWQDAASNAIRQKFPPPCAAENGNERPRSRSLHSRRRWLCATSDATAVATRSFRTRASISSGKGASRRPAASASPTRSMRPARQASARRNT